VTVPGGVIPAAGVTMVGVLPSHRRRGLLTAMMRRQLDDVRDRGEPLALLWASESGIYGRFGYGVGALASRFRFDRGAAFEGPPSTGGRISLMSKDAALAAFPPVYDQVRLGQPGMVDRPGGWWFARLADTQVHRGDFGRFFFAAHESDRVDGYAVYRFEHHWPEGGPEGTVEVVELLATTPEAYAELWRFCLDLDLAARVEAWRRPPDDPILFMLADPRRARVRIQDSLWVRPVDVAAALAARRYAVKDRLRLEIRDPFCPWNEGRYELVGGPDGAECHRTDAYPDLELSAADLGAVYLGGMRWGPLARAGRVKERSPRAVRRADLMFGWDPAPWCPHVF
jgi:predicted acetyltransferase